MRLGRWCAGTAARVLPVLLCALLVLAWRADAQIALVAQPIAGRDRVAIVVGNEDYAVVPDLSNAVRDAEDMARLLRDFGFSVHEGYNLDRRGFESLLRTALLNLPEGADVVFFYAGHGIQIGRRNYLLPVDVDFADVYDLPVYSITLDRVIDALSARGATHVAIIDACRENPFPNLRLAADLDATIFEAQGGFEVLRTPLNSLVAFSTSPGAVAFDGEDGRNSPYTEAVLSSARSAPEESIQTLFSAVRERVYEATGGRQVPWESSTLVRPFRFMDSAAVVPVQAPAEHGASAGAGSGTPSPAEGGRSAADLPPVTFDLGAMLDRRVALGTQIEAELGRALVAPAIVTPAGAGQVAIDPETADIVYRPELAEVRATQLESHLLSDRFQIETGPAAARQTVTVNLTLQADPCDLHAGDALDLQGVGLYRLPNEIVVEAALAACTEAIRAHPDTPRFRYQLGRAQQADGDLEAAFGSFQAAREAGHIRAMNAEAFLLFTIRIDRDLVGIPLDIERAHALLEQGIAAGDAFAIHARGLRLLRDGATPSERERGFELLDRAVELGHTYSMNELGIYFLTRDTPHYQPERGLTYLQASSARDDIYGHHNLGFVALAGLDGNPPDFDRARRFFERAATGGHPASPSTLGRMIMRGQLGPVDQAAAARWFDEGLARGDGWGGVNAANIILAGGLPGAGPADAAVRAAKALHLPAGDAAEAAETLLKQQDARTLGRALQIVLADLGEPVTVDGAVGPGTRSALERVRAGAGLPRPADTPMDRLTTATKAYWAARPTRPDLF